MAAGHRARLHKLGGHSGGETPLPIPNREVKPVSADGTRSAIPRESRTPPITFEGPARGPSGRSRRRELLAPVRVELAQPADALADRRVRDEERREALLRERVRRVERLGRRARLERHEPHRLLEPEQRVGETVRRVAQLCREAVGLVLALRREHRWTNDAATGPSTNEKRRWNAAADARGLDDRRAAITTPRSGRARRGAGGAPARARRSPRAPPATRRRAARPRARARSRRRRRVPPRARADSRRGST